MSDRVEIEDGGQPWKPTAETELTAVFHSFTIPLVGVIQQGGVHFLFWCVVGHSAPENAWAYARIESVEEVEQLRVADGAMFDTELRDIVGERASTFAIASDEEGIIQWVELEPPSSFDHVADRGMREIGIKFQEVLTEYSRLSEQFPLIAQAANLGIVPNATGERMMKEASRT